MRMAAAVIMLMRSWGCCRLHQATSSKMIFCQPSNSNNNNNLRAFLQFPSLEQPSFKKRRRRWWVQPKNITLQLYLRRPKGAGVVQTTAVIWLFIVLWSVTSPALRKWGIWTELTDTKQPRRLQQTQISYRTGSRNSASIFSEWIIILVNLNWRGKADKMIICEPIFFCKKITVQFVLRTGLYSESDNDDLVAWTKKSIMKKPVLN